MRHMTLVAGVLALVLLCGSNFGDDETERQHPQWARLMEQVREAWGVGDTARGTEKLLLAVELAKGYASPLPLARSLDLVGGQLVSIDVEEALKVLEKARSIKVAELGPRSAGVADTLMVMAGAVWVRDYSPEEPENRVKSALPVYEEARDIRAEVFGEGSCDVGEVDVYIGIVYESLGRLDAAETLYREVMSYCPDDPDGGARAALLHLLYDQGRDEEAEEMIYAMPADEPKPNREPIPAGELGPGINDVIISDAAITDPESQ